jgi:hypothetical protein
MPRLLCQQEERKFLFIFLWRDLEGAPFLRLSRSQLWRKRAGFSDFMAESLRFFLQ